MIIRSVEELREVASVLPTTEVTALAENADWHAGWLTVELYRTCEEIDADIRSVIPWHQGELARCRKAFHDGASAVLGLFINDEQMEH